MTYYDNDLFGGKADRTPEGPESSGDFWLTDSFEGLGLGFAGALEGILELGSIIPGIDYDIPDNFGLGHAETGAGRFVEGMATFMLPFFGGPAGWISRGATLGKGAKALSLIDKGGRLAGAASKVQGGAYKLGKHITGSKLGLNKRIEPWHTRIMQEKAALSAAGGFGNTVKGSVKGFQGALVNRIPEATGAMIGGAMVDFAVWDPQEARLSNMVQGIPGLANPVTAFLQMDEHDSKLVGRIKQTLEGAGLGLMVDGFIGGIKGLHKARRVFKATGSSESAQRAYTQEVIENNIAVTQREFGFNRMESIAFHTARLGINPHAIHWGDTMEQAEKAFFQVERDAVPKHMRDLLTPDDLAQLNATAAKEVDRLITTSLDGGLDQDVVKNLARVGESVRGEYDRMGNKILPEMYPAQKELGRTEHDGGLWTATNAILSPNQEVAVHTSASMMILSNWRAAGRPTNKRAIRRLIDDAVKKTGAEGKSLEGMKKNKKYLVDLFSKADGLTPGEILDHVNKKLIKTREFAAGYRGGWYSGIALDVHMGHILDPTVWDDATKLYNKTAGGYEGVGATAYRALLRKSAKEMGGGWTGTEIQETVWASIASIKGLLQHYRGNVDEVLNNMYGENIAKLWDHNTVLRDALANPEFEKILKAGGASDEVIANMKNGEGVFAPREGIPGVATEGLDRESLRKAVNTIQQYTKTGVSSGAPGIMKKNIARMGAEALARKFNMNAPNFVKGNYDNLIDEGVVFDRGIVSPVDAYGKKMGKTQKGKTMETQHYSGDTIGAVDAQGRAVRPPGLSDSWRPRPDIHIPKAHGSADAAVTEGKSIAVRFDDSGSQTITTAGGGKVITQSDHATLRNVSFDVGGKKPLVKGDYVPGKPNADGVEVTYDGKFFVTEQGYAIRSADEVSLIGDKAYAKGDVKYWTEASAFGVKKGAYRQLRVDGKLRWLDMRSANRLTKKQYKALSKEERSAYVAAVPKDASRTVYIKPGDMVDRPKTLEGMEGRPKSEGLSGEGPLIGSGPASQGQTKFLFQGAEEGVEGAKGVTFLDKLGNIFIRGFSNADASTGFHELMHGWRLLHANRAITEADRIATGGLLDIELDALEAAMGIKKGAEWTTEQDETLALWWEKFVHEGKVWRGEGDAALSDRDFDILQVAMTKMSKAQRRVYEGVEHTLPEGAIPEELRSIFNAAVNRSDVQAVMDSVGDEARAMYDSVLIGSSRGGRTAVEEELHRFEGDLDAQFPKWRTEEGYKELPHGEKVKLGRRRASVRRQQDAVSTAAEGAGSRATTRRRAEEGLESLHKNLDEKYKDGWSDRSLDPEDLAALRAAREALRVTEGDIGFASRALEPEGPRTSRTPESGLPEAERSRDLPINVERGVGTMDDLASGDDARDLLEQYVREEEDWLMSQKDFDRAEIEAQEAKHYEDLASASRRGQGSVKKFFDTTTEQGRKFIAKSRAIRSFATDVFSSAEEAAARIEASRAMGKVDREAQADFLYFTGLFEPLTEQLNVMSHQMGFGLQGMKEEPFGRVISRAMDEETVDLVLGETARRLQGARGAEESVDVYIDRMLVAMKEGQLSLVNAATTVNGDKLDVVLEVFYNSILSGTRTQSVNTLSNLLYGVTLHIERRLGRQFKRMMGSEDFPKTIGTVVGIREMLKDSFKMARIAFDQGSSQYDVAGGRATFDRAKGVYSGKPNRAYADRLGAKNMPEPFRSAMNAMLNITAVGGYPVRLLGSMDELFKQMHSRVIVQEELAMKAAKLHADDPTAMAKYIRDEFDMIIGKGNHYTKKRVKYDGLQEAYAQGLNKREARRYAEDYVNRVWSKDRSALADRALDFSRRSTFTHPNAPEVGLNPVSRQVQKVGNALSAASQQVRWLRFMAPFINTPTNLLSEASDHLLSPVFDGAVPGYKNLKRIIGDGAADPALKGTPQEQADALGRLAVSSSIISLVWMKVNSGEITGGGPKDPAALRLLRGAGWQPYSVRFGDTYLGYGRLDPLASVVGIVADIAEGMNGNPYTDDPEEEGVKALLMGTTMALFRNLSEKSYLSGIINFASALDNPEYYGKNFAYNLTGSIVPNVSAQIAGEMDPTQREVRGIVDKWKARVPFMGDDLLPRRNFMGQEEKRIQYAGGPLLGLLSPIPLSQVSNDPIRREVTKFGEVIGPPSPLKYGTLDLREYAGSSGQTAYDRYQELAGIVTRGGKTMEESMLDTIQGSEYTNLPDFTGDGADSPKMDLLRGQVTKYRSKAWQELLKEFPLLRENHDITLYNRSARSGNRAERDLLSLIK